MKRIISHRGNVEGPNPLRENDPFYVREAHDKHGFDVEIDVWFVEGKFYLGHDKPQYPVNAEFFRKNWLWCHAKNHEALFELCRLGGNFDYFWHQEDDITITSDGFFWTYPGKTLSRMSIAVLPERVPGWDLSKCIGVCTDYPTRYIEKEKTSDEQSKLR